jgi:hypothetical protein
VRTSVSLIPSVALADGDRPLLKCISANPWTPSNPIISNPIDFCDARRLKEVTFRLSDLDSSWCRLALQTLTSEHRDLRQISIHVPAHPPGHQPELPERIYEEWIGIDLTLVRLWELHAVHIRLICVMKGGKQEECDSLEKLLPEVMKKEIYELVDHDFLRSCHTL